MRMSTGFKTLVFLLLALVLALPGSLVLAQGGDGEGEPEEPEIPVEFEFMGEIVEISEDGIFVMVYGEDGEDGIEFVLAPAGSFQPSGFEVGDMVEFNGRMLNDGTIQVTELQLVEDDEGEGEEGEGEEGEGEEGEGEEGEEEEGEGEEGEGEEGEEEDGDCGFENHPVLTAIADEFEVEYDEVEGYFCDGYGVGEVARAYIIAEQLAEELEEGMEGMSVEEILAMREDGMGWGPIMRELEVDPGSLAPGRAISAQKNRNRQDGEAPGNSGNAPGQQGREEGNGRGNSDNAPGKQKDGAPGNSGNAPGRNR